MVKFLSERSEGRRLSLEMRLFSDWLNSHSLVDLQLSGATFTWSNHKDRPTMSRLDRFVVSVDWVDRYSELC